MDKATLRQTLLAKRSSCDAADLAERSEKICGKFIEVFRSYDVFLLYFPIRCEVDTKPLADKLFSMGKEIYLPAVEGENLLFRRFKGYQDMRSGAFGIKEACGEIFRHESECVVTVPGVAFDEQCGRLGFGKGFYDRFLSHHKNLIKVGLAYGFQVAKSVYPQSHDITMDIVITENRVINNNMRGINNIGGQS